MSTSLTKPSLERLEYRLVTKSQHRRPPYRRRVPTRVGRIRTNTPRCPFRLRFLPRQQAATCRKASPSEPPSSTALLLRRVLVLLRQRLRPRSTLRLSTRNSIIVHRFPSRPMNYRFFLLANPLLMGGPRRCTSSSSWPELAHHLFTT